MSTVSGRGTGSGTGRTSASPPASRSTSQACFCGRPRRTSTAAASRCSAPVDQGLRAVQVAQGDVVHAVEHRLGDPVDAADADVALALAGLGAADEGVRQHDRPHPGRRNRSARMRSMAARARPRARAPRTVQARAAPPRARGTGGRRSRRRRARRRAAPARRARRVSARTCSPAAASRPEKVPSRRAESWLPGVRTTAARRPGAGSPVEHRGGVGRRDGAVVDVARDRTTSTCSAATTAASCASTASCSASRSVPCSDRPRCQSEVCSSRMARKVCGATDRTGQARL